MASTPQRISRSQTSPPSPRVGTRTALKSSSSFHGGAATPPRTIPQTTLTSLPPRLHVPSAAATVASSAASFITNVESGDGILLRDAAEDGGEVAENEEIAEGVFATTKDDSDERKKSLREQLKKTLSRRHADDSLRPARWKGKLPDLQETVHISGELYPQRQYFVLTDAGKPVFVSRPRTADEDLATITGITSALVSVFADDTLTPSANPSSGTDKLRCINAGSTRITFFLRPPLYYVSVSKWKEPESVTRMHLEYLHLQILSVVTASQLRRIFERRANFDLRRLLEGAESFLHILISRLQLSLALCATLSALCSLRLDASLRDRAGDFLVPSSKNGNLNILYTLLISGDNVITLVRPKKHSVHPVDLHILLNALHNPSIAAMPASWLPICLPKFNPQGFVHAYVSFLEQQLPPPLVANPGPATTKDDLQGSTHRSNTAGQNDSLLGPAVSALTESLSSTAEGSTPNDITINESSNIKIVLSETTFGTGAEPPKECLDEKAALDPQLSASKHGLTLVIVSAGGEFDAIRRWSECISKKLETTGLTSLLQAAAKAAPYTCSQLAIPGLKHFLYKNRTHVQVTYPIWDEEYDTLDSRRRLITLYQTLHDAIHAKSGQGNALKLQYVRTDEEAAMGWITQPFELYVALSPRLPKSAAIGAANAVARWVKREESRLFLRDAPIF